MSKSIALLAGCVVIAVGCSIVCVASAATVNWSGSANTNWSLGGVGGNWSNAAIPTSADIARFTHLGEGGASNTLTNQVDVAFPETGGISTIQALVYEINPTDSTLYYHRTEIVANRTLLATNNWTVNRVTGGLPLTEATINLEIAGGPGSKFQVGNTDATTATVVLGNHGSTNTKININIDMSELETFHAYVNTFGAAATNQPVPFNLQLAKNNLIRGNMLDFAYAGGNNSNPVNMYLGETNTLHLNDIKLSTWKTPGTVEFNSIWTNPELTIRGLTGGTSRANLQLGISEASTGTVTTGVLNLSGGTVDAMLDTLTLAAANLGGQTIGTFTMSDGVVDALTVLAGQSSGASNGIATATLNIQGGLFIANNMTLGQRLASASAQHRQRHAQHLRRRRHRRLAFARQQGIRQWHGHRHRESQRGLAHSGRHQQRRHGSRHNQLYRRKIGGRFDWLQLVAAGRNVRRRDRLDHDHRRLHPTRRGHVGSHLD